MTAIAPIKAKPVIDLWVTGRLSYNTASKPATMQFAGIASIFPVLFETTNGI